MAAVEAQPMRRNGATRIVLLGPPGAGKGTQAQLLAQHLEVPRISTGDILREAIAAGTPLGNQAAPVMEQGGLVPDDILIGVIDERLRKDDCQRGYILDGFPRTVPQAEGFDSMDPEGVKDLQVVSVEVPHDELLRRLSGRRWCPRCQATYHVDNNPPRRQGVCDRDGNALIQREDDKEAAVGRRLEAYDKQTRPLIEYYQNRAEFHRVNGHRDVSLVFSDLRKAVEERAS